MRPLRLELEGFTAFRGHTVLDLRDLDLFAITGQTGAGKSSLIDAICYALYGRVPRVVTEVGSCISLGLDRMWVKLEFLAGESQYRVFRETRRGRQGLIQLEEFSDGEWQARAGRAREVNERVQRLVGLDFDGFVRSVLLPQGEFQELLVGDREKRRDVLRKLLQVGVYEGVRARAAGRAQQLGAQVQDRQHLLDTQYRDATPETLDAKRRDLDQLRVEIESLQREVESLREAQVIAARAWEAGQSAAAAAAERESATAKLGESQMLIEQGEGNAAALRTAIEALDAAIAANPFDPDRLAALSAAAEIVRSVESARAQALAAQQKAVQSTKLAEQATADEHESTEAALRADAAFNEADAAFHEAQHRNAAVFLRLGLKVGDACPVCGARVAEISDLDRADAQAAQSRREATRRVQEEKQKAASDARARAAAASAALEAEQVRAQHLAAELKDREADLAERIPSAEDRAGPAIQAAIKEQREAQAARARQQGERKAQADQLVGLQDLLGQARSQLATHQERARAAEARQHEAESEAASARMALATRAIERGWTELGAAPSGSLDPRKAIARRLGEAEAERDRANTRHGDLDRRIASLEEDIRRADELRKEIEGVRAEHGVSSDLALMMRADRFQAFVQSEALRILADNGSDRLQELSAGRYRLAVSDAGQDFEVIDQWNGDDRRSVRTLSGGETFLASLALALALAESLPGLAAGRSFALDSIFLDEGFGSLDPDALGLAADALDALRASHRMVCVITHLKELADRLPARVLVHKAQQGSTVEVM